jgi:chromosome segregation ATPase
MRAISPLGPALAEFFGLSDEAKRFMHARDISREFGRLPGLSAEERTRARDKELASESALWRARFKQLSEDLSREKALTRSLQDRLDRIQSSWVAAADEPTSAAQLSESIEELDQERARASLLEENLGSLNLRLTRILAGLQSNEPPVSSGVSQVA